MFSEVLIFIQQGCPACAEIHEIAQRVCSHYGACARWRFVDANQENILADVMQVRETPTVIGTQGFQPVIRIVGANDFEPRLVALYGKLLDGASCPVGAWRGDV